MCKFNNFQPLTDLAWAACGHDFYATQILREINFGHLEAQKTAI